MQVPKLFVGAAQYKSAVVGTIHLITLPRGPKSWKSVGVRETVERGGNCSLVLLELKSVSSTSALLPLVLRGRWW